MTRVKTKVTHHVERVKINPLVAKVHHRYSEKALHVPADMAVIVAAVTALANAGTIVLLAALVLAALGAVVFSA